MHAFDDQKLFVVVHPGLNDRRQLLMDDRALLQVELVRDLVGACEDRRIILSRGLVPQGVPDGVSRERKQILVQPVGEVVGDRCFPAA